MKKIITAMLACAAFLGACKDEDLYDPNAGQSQYNNNFIENYGQIDPEQDWNMATAVQARADINYAPGQGEMRIYTSNPVESGCRLMAKAELTDGNGAISFDAIKGMGKAFVTIASSGRYQVYDYYDIVDGVLTVSNDTHPSAKAPTRAADCTLGSQQTFITPGHAIWNDQYVFCGKTYKDANAFLDDWLKAQNRNGENSWTYFTKDFIENLKATDPNAWQVTSTTPVQYTTYDWQTYYIKNECFVNISPYVLQNVPTADATPYPLKWGYEMLGPGTFFDESKLYYQSPKLGTLYDLDGQRKIEKGIQITTTGGKVTIPYIYGGTQSNDQMGYVYYKDGQDPLQRPHYILMNNQSGHIYATPSTGDKNNDPHADARTWTDAQDDIYNNGSPGMGLTSWVTDPGTGRINDRNYYKDDLIHTKQYSLMYFGEDGKSAVGTEDFPAGWHVAFFIINKGHYDQGTPLGNLADCNYTDPELNKRIRNYYANSSAWNNATNQRESNQLWMDNCTEEHGHTVWDAVDNCRGAVKAAAWTYRGHTFMGFEDGGRDEDLNDIVFQVNGAYTIYPETDQPIVVPDPTPTPEPYPTPTPTPTNPDPDITTEPNGWYLACEDLGDTEDSDFNDVVLKIDHVAGSDKASCWAFAAGGVMEAHVMYDGNYITSDYNNAEIHSLLNHPEKDKDNRYKMINTDAFKEWGKTINYTVPTNYHMSDHKISVQVWKWNGSGSDEGRSTNIYQGKDVKGSAPLMICVPGDWKAPLERVNIGVCYPEFTNWVQNSQYTDWWKHPADGQYVK